MPRSWSYWSNASTARARKRAEDRREREGIGEVDDGIAREITRGMTEGEKRIIARSRTLENWEAEEVKAKVNVETVTRLTSKFTERQTKDPSVKDPE